MSFSAPRLPIHRQALAKLGTFFEAINSVPPYRNAGNATATTDRRGEERTRDRTPIQFFVDDRALGYQGTLINGSDGGAFIETHKTLPLLSHIRIEGPGFTCQAVVCRVHWLGPEERVTRSGGMAVRVLSRKEHNHGVMLAFQPALVASL